MTGCQPASLPGCGIGQERARKVLARASVISFAALPFLLASTACQRGSNKKRRLVNLCLELLIHSCLPGVLVASPSFIHYPPICYWWCTDREGLIHQHIACLPSHTYMSTRSHFRPPPAPLAPRHRNPPAISRLTRSDPLRFSKVTSSRLTILVPTFW